ncbi:hypothetical protein Tco_1213522 [Tanacetum coccineum]
MAIMAKNIIAAGSKNRLMMLEKCMYDSLKTQIILYIQGKENGEILKESINNGPFKLKLMIIVKDTDGTTDIILKQLKTLLHKRSYDTTVTSKLLIYFFLDFQLTFTLSLTTFRLQKKYGITTQEIIQNGQVTVQNVQGRQSQGYAGSAGKNQATRARVVNTFGNARANQPRVKDFEWFKDKMLLAQVQEVGVVLNDEQHDFLADSLEETNDCQDLQFQATTNYKADHVDAYDSDYDDEVTANAIFMESLSPVVSINDDTVEPRYDSDIFSESYDELTSNNNVIPYDDYMVTISNDADNYVPPPV